MFSSGEGKHGVLFAKDLTSELSTSIHRADQGCLGRGEAG